MNINPELIYTYLLIQKLFFLFHGTFKDYITCTVFMI